MMETMKLSVETPAGSHIHAGELRAMLRRWSYDDTLVIEANDGDGPRWAAEFPSSRDLDAFLMNLSDYDAVVFVDPDGSRWVPVRGADYVLGGVPNELHIVVEREG